MTYMSVDKKALINDLKLQIAEITYLNDEGATRKAIITLHQFYVPPDDRMNIEAIANRDPRPNVVTVYDVNHKAWRIIPLDRTIAVQAKDGW